MKKLQSKNWNIFSSKRNNANSDQVRLAIKDAYKRLLSPSMETEFRNLAKIKADEAAIKVFAENLKQLLLSPPWVASASLP